MKFLNWRRRSAVEQEMREEMQFHLNARIATHIERGMTPEEAARAARIEFGSAEAHRDDCRAALGCRPWDELRSDLRFAARGLRKNPGYAITAIAILALGIGINSAFFTLFSHYVLKPLPIRGADRHFDMAGIDRHGQTIGGWTLTEIDSLRQATRPQIEDLYVSRTIQVLVLDPSQRLSAVCFVSGNYFRLLGGSATTGRTFSESDQRQPLAVLSRSGQRRHFPNDPAPLGKTLRVRNTLFTVIGIMPPEFTGTDSIVPDFWAGIEIRSALPEQETATEPRHSVSGLLAPGVSIAQAEAAITAAAIRLSHAGEEPLTRVIVRANSSMVAADEDFKIAAALVFAACLAVLAIACANLANLCLSRAVSRTHEIATRLSLGASRGRIVRQLLTESILMALFGAAGGLAFGALAVQEAQRRILTFAGGLGIALLPVAPDWRVFAYSATLGVLAGLAFGLLPAIEITSPSLAISSKRDHSLFAGRVRPRRMRDLLIVGQIASSLVLLVLAGVLVRHLQGLTAHSPGYDLDRIYDLKLDRPRPALLAALEKQPFVAGITAVDRVLLYGEMHQRPANVAGRQVSLAYNYVDPHFFDTLALPVEGRGFTALDASTNAKVVIISQATARKLWPHTTPLGQSIEDSQAGGAYQVIGLVPDVISGWLFRGEDATAVYFPAAAGQTQIHGAMVRINGNPAPAIAAIRKLCATVADAAGCEPTSLREVSALQRFPFEGAALVAGALGILALVLTTVGLYSVTSYSVVHRRREIGVHLALGASPAQVTRRLLGEAARCVAAGLAIGLPVCLILSRVLNSSVFGIHALDLGVYTGVPLLLAIFTAFACALPARRASHMDPMESLREE